MQSLSVVIVCRNGAAVIGQTIKSFSGLTDDIIVFDNGSSDGTQQIVKQTPAKLFEGGWEGFGKTKNKANALAKYDWILSLDADEAIDEELKSNLLGLDLSDEMKVYEIRFKNFLGTNGSVLENGVMTSISGFLTGSISNGMMQRSMSRLSFHRQSKRSY